MKLLPVVAALLTGALVACGGGAGSSATSTPASATSTAASSGSTPAPAASATRPAAATAGAAIPDVKLQRVFANVSIKSMTGLYQTSDGRWFALEQDGQACSSFRTARTPNQPSWPTSPTA